MAKPLQILAVYKLPATFNLSSDCYGKDWKIKIGNLECIATLPTLDWTRKEPRIVSPTLDAEIEKNIKHFTEKSEEGWERLRYWGSVTGYNPTKRTINIAHLGAIIIRFETLPSNITYSDYLHGRGHPEGDEIKELFQNIDGWFESMRAWIEVAKDQDANPENPVTTGRIQGDGLHVFTIEGKVISLPTTPTNLTVVLNSSEQVSLPLLRKIVTQVNNEIVPSDAHLLLRDSRAAIRRQQFRRAVIDAGSATEITLADFNNKVTHIVPNGRSLPTLGWYVRQPAIISGANLPNNIISNLVDIRNNAIHQNRTPTRDETVKSLSLAKEVVDILDPLPL